jgi:hypothetical protein
MYMFSIHGNIKALSVKYIEIIKCSLFITEFHSILSSHQHADIKM